MDTEELEMSSREKQQLADEMSRKPSKNDENKETLRAVICVCRHGDRWARRHAMKRRTPKQKMKFKVTSESLLNKLKPWGPQRRVRRSVITDDGRINENGAPYTGMMRFDVRVKLEEDLKSARARRV